VRSQVREESSEGGSVGGRDTDFGGACCWQGVFEQCYNIGAGRVASRKESFEEWNLGSLAIEMAEIVKI
jgi:hypothetical protein